MSRGAGRTRPVTAAQVKQFAGKAEEYLAVAVQASDAGQHNAAAGNAIHAAINACDAILGARTGQRPSGQDHHQAITAVAGVPDVGKEAAAALARLLPLKTTAEYDPAPISASDSRRAIEQAQRIVRLMRRTIPTA